MLSRLDRFDRRLMQRSARARTPALDRLLVNVGRAASYSRLWLAIAGVLASTGGPRGKRAAAHGLASIAIAAAIANGPVKLLVRRQRPGRSSRPTLIAMPHSSSFPSGHSAAAFAFATGVCLDLPQLTPVLAPLAIAVAYSRVHTGVHHPSDVATGAAIGIGAAGIVTVWRPPPPHGNPVQQRDLLGPTAKVAGDVDFGRPRSTCR
jgi:membrane-associated phospholipid phosphatase